MVMHIVGRMALAGNGSRKFIIAALIGAFVAICVYLWATWNHQTTDDAAIEANVASISAKLSGYVASIEITDNQHVEKGQVLITLDKTDYAYALDKARAAHTSAEAELAAALSSLESSEVTAPSTIESAKSQVDAAHSRWVKASADLQRVYKLDDRVRSKQQIDEVIAAEQAAKSDLDDAVARFKSAKTAPKNVEIARSRVQELQAMLESAKAELAMSDYNIQNTVVRAPFSGKVAKRGVEVGNFIQPGQKLMAVVSDDYWVVANFKETQIAKMKAGQKVKIYIDAFPSKTYAGKVDSLQAATGARFSIFPPENATGNYVKVVQRVPVKIVFEDKPPLHLPIGPGMSVEPTVYTE